MTYEITVNNNSTLPIIESRPNITTGGSTSYGNWDITSPSTTYNWTYTNTIYLYQVRCPRKGCRRYNWLELDKITPCSNCGSELKAVSKKPDFEIEVG